MQYKCEVCQDTGSISKHLSGNLDCVSCEAATEREALGNWMDKRRALGEQELCWLVHQRALAMVPKQELNCEFHAEGAIFVSSGSGCANPINYGRGGMRVDLSGWTCYAPGAAPAVANGAEDIKDMAQARRVITQLRAAAGPDAALVQAARNVVTCFNDPHTSLAYVARWVNELSEEIAALSGAKGN